MEISEANLVMERLRADPVFFCRHALGVRLWRKQAEVLLALRDNPRVAVRSGHGTGKSFVASAAALWFLYSHYPAKVITTAPTQNQVRNILWKEIRALHSRARVPLGGKALEEMVKLSDDVFAVGISTDEADRFQGYHAEHLLVILDEAPGVREEIWEVAETLLTGRVGKLLAIGNPTRPAGRFYRAFAHGSSWAKVHVSCLDSPNLGRRGGLPYPSLVTGEWIESRRRDWGEGSPLWRSRILGEFPEDETSLLVPRAWLEFPPAGRSSEAAAVTGGAGGRGGVLTSGARLGVDVARHGDDRTAFVLRDAAGVIRAETHNGWSTMETAGRAIGLMEEFGLAPEQVFVDDTGLGAGVTDRLREQGLDVNAVIASSRAADPAHFANCRAECYWRLRRALAPEAGEARFRIAPAYAELREELAAITFSYTSGGAIRIRDKTALKSFLGRSPDCADALALTFAPARLGAPEAWLA